MSRPGREVLYLGISIASPIVAAGLYLAWCWLEQQQWWHFGTDGLEAIEIGHAALAFAGSALPAVLRPGAPSTRVFGAIAYGVTSAVAYEGLVMLGIAYFWPRPW